MLRSLRTRMRDTVAYLQSFARFPLALRAFLRRPLTLQQARAIVAERVEQREPNCSASSSDRSTTIRRVRI
jgi:hypothetical protein